MPSSSLERGAADRGGEFDLPVPYANRTADRAGGVTDSDAGEAGEQQQDIADSGLHHRSFGASTRPGE